METNSASVPAAAEDLKAKAVNKRYEGLVMVRTKAIKGKGAWYWAHLEPILVPSSDSGEPKAVKLRCSLCDARFSASNPSRTASEHLKRGTCPNFASPSGAGAAGGSGGGGLLPHNHNQHSKAISFNNRKRSSSLAATPVISYQIAPLAIVDPSRFSLAGAGGDVIYSSSSTPPLLSGGREDLGALAMLEDSVKKLKSPKVSPGPALSKTQIDSALSLLSDWFYESSGTVSFSSVEHPKFRAFLQKVGLPPFSRRELAGARLDSRYEEARSDADARIRDALFFQVAADGWKNRSPPDGESVVSFTVNLPNGTPVFRRALVTNGRAPSKYAEEVLWDTISDVCGGAATSRCAGIVSDRFKSSALRNLENQNHWMINLSCQLQAFRSLIKNFARDLLLLRNVTANSSRIAAFFNNISPARSILHKYQAHELGRTCLLRCPAPPFVGDVSPLFAMFDDLLASARPLQLAVHDEAYNLLCHDVPDGRDLSQIILNNGFWSDLEAAHSLHKIIAAVIQEMEATRPLVGQCLPLWEEVKSKIKQWCVKYRVDESDADKVFDESFKKNYHPAWAAAFILDPLYLTKDTSGRYLPPYKRLTPEQEKDVDRLITRLASRDEAHIALNELMKWRSEGMDPLYAQAVQVRQLDPATGKMRIANPQSSRLVWETCLSEEYRSLARVAVRLIFLHATAGGFRCNFSLLQWVRRQWRSPAAMDRAQKVMFVAANSRLERRDFSNEEEKDAELFANGEDDAINETFMDGSSV
ncbi:hypothetical protein AXF42_Ash019023 [Apostasia shenzhenica]|uniref:DUF7963 domain-containing protein n=1 Tax=Apostasia shenzhenica TaxID=1088818 RepID=A0A2I0AC78_9ASPA|nr:hypothetical protein AXF42_Ash019023 [Apostasia shenzhenica]